MRTIETVVRSMEVAKFSVPKCVCSVFVFDDNRIVYNELHTSESIMVMLHFDPAKDYYSIIMGIVLIFLDPYYRTVDGFKVLIEKV